MRDSDEPEMFRTLARGRAGEEPDEPVYFAFSATLRIHGEGLPSRRSPHARGLPTHSHRKGERRGPRSSGYRDDAWHFQPVVPESEPFERHIDSPLEHCQTAT